LSEQPDEIEKEKEKEALPALEAKAEPLTALAPEAVEAQKVALSSSGAAESERRLTIFDLAAGVLILAFFSLFAINCFIANLGLSYNEEMCGVAMGLAGKAATEGKDTDEVRRMAFGFMDKCGKGGFFIERPELITFYDEIKPDLRQVTVATATRVLIPAPFICIDKSRFEEDGMHVVFKHIYQFKLNNPKNCNTGKVKINPTGKTFEIKMIDNPVKDKGPDPKHSQSLPKKKTGLEKVPKPASNSGGAG